MPRFLFSVLFCASAIAAASGEDWPQFRGPNASGVGAGDPPTTWNVGSGEHVIWRSEIPGLGLSSPTIWGDRIYVTTAISEAPKPELKTGWMGGSVYPVNDDAKWVWKLLCLDKKTGKQVWEHTLHRGVPAVKRHPKSSHANCTVAADGNHLVVFLGSEGLFCYTMDGEAVWKQSLGHLNAAFKMMPGAQWGFASSPIIHDGEVIVQCDCANTSFWATFDVETGKERLHIDREDWPCWSTPTVSGGVDGGDAQVIFNGYQNAAGYDLKTGERLWWISGGGDIPVPTPVVADGIAFLTNAHGASSPIYAVQLDARGNLTPSAESDPPDGMAWWTRRQGSYMPTPIVVDGLLYVGDDNGRLRVFDVKSGERKYQERIAGGGATYSASPVAAGGKIYFTDEFGKVHVVKAGPEYELLATNDMGEICMATPALSGDQIFIRTQSKLYCIGE